MQRAERDMKLKCEHLKPSDECGPTPECLLFIFLGGGGNSSNFFLVSTLVN